MTSLFTARRRAEEFASALDAGALRDVRDPELAQLVGLATAVRNHPAPAPRPEFTAELRSRLMVEAEAVLRADNTTLALPPRPRGARERRLVAAASAVVLIGGTAGMAAAAQDALPGEALYPVKRGIERAQAELSISEAGRGRDLLGQAADRLTEVQGLVAGDSAQNDAQVPATLADFTEQAHQGAGLLLESFEQERDPEAITDIRTFAADGILTLGELADEVTPDAEDELAQAARTLQQLDQQAAAACDTCADQLPALEIPGLILARNEVDRALEQAAGDALNNDHPVVVPRGAVKHRRPGAHQDAPQKSDGSAVSPPEVAPGPDGAGGTGALDPQVPQPDDLTTGLPDVEKPASEKPSTGGGGVVDDLTDGLGDAVETLLPDSDLGDGLNDGLGDGLDDGLGSVLDPGQDGTSGSGLGGLLP